MNSLLLLLGLLCHMLPLLFRYASGVGNSYATSTLELSRASSIFMLIAYVAYIFFQLKTHRQVFDSQEVISSTMPALNVKNSKTKLRVHLDEMSLKKGFGFDNRMKIRELARYNDLEIEL